MAAVSLRRLARLSRRADRSSRRQFLADGPLACGAAVAAAARGHGVVHELLLTDAASQRFSDLVTAAAQVGATVTSVTDGELGALVTSVNPQGVVAHCDFVDEPLESVLTGARPPQLVALMTHVRDPGNVGSVLRVMDAAGADAVLVSGGSVDPYNPKAVRASVGSIFNVALATEVDVVDALATLRERGLQVLAADASGPSDLDDLERGGQLRKPTAWVFGNEAWGLPSSLLELVDDVVRIPIYGRAESLNLATAVTLCAYASARSQRAVKASR